MAFSSHWTVGCIVVLSLCWVRVSAAAGVSVNCGECEKSRCPKLHYCEGQAVKDHCGCCTVCSSPRYQPHPLIGNSDNGGDGDDVDDLEVNACAKVKCPKFKVCMENMQGLPLCTCPGPFICKQRRSRQRPVCGTDGVTYQSRCYLRIAACNSATKIKVARRGPCTGAEVPKPRACDSVKSCRKRKNQHLVCGTDGKTYTSRCHMKIVACQRGVKIKLKNHGVCAASATPGRGSVTEQRIQSPTVPTSSVDRQAGADVRGRKDRRRRKKKGGTDGSGKEDGKRKRRKQRREKRKKRQRRRKRRKTRGQSRQRRFKMDRRQVLRNLAYSRRE